MNQISKQPLAVIAGPTATGKSAHALRLAADSGGVIINADASQLYADLNILSARPSAEEVAAAPHRLYGVRDGADPASASEWASLAKVEIDAAHRAGRLPILVGGTGLYLNILLDGIAPVPEIDPAIRADVRALDAASLAAALAHEDPLMAARLRPTDTQRLARALEVIRSTKTSLSSWQQKRAGGIAGDVTVRAQLIDLSREALYTRCDLRLDQMMAAGGLAEVETLAARKLPPSLPVMKAIGVPPLMAYLAGHTSLETALETAKRDTRRYAKRQQTWFRTQFKY